MKAEVSSNKLVVFVGLSGGVDSSVAAALLLEQGYSVVGVYMKNWSRDVAGHHCPWQEDLTSARSVAAHLQVPLKIYDFEKEYYEAVTQYMLDSYKSGLTPNPDVMCNQKIKFDTFYKKCLEDGADYIATGHYAVMEAGRLMVAKDSNKDQTYFLYRMNPSIAQKVLFPIGDLHKSEVRELASKYHLPTAKRPDSQGLCFVGNVPMRDFLSEFIEPKLGDIVDESGNKLGEHNGAFSYTIGQRHGLGIGGGQPYFVYQVDTKHNIVRVTSDESSPLLNRTEFIIADCVWWDTSKTEGKMQKLEVRVRYRSNTVPCSLELIQKGKYRVVLSKPERAIAPGQSAVFYEGDIVVGGGIIQLWEN
jgi:tRNA-specific 2-thiouridylase